ncbi:hypothetical protein H6P81_005546 [Aristolochia fimbriata]|uniref:Uncharacterized protein n=1 Tax=Aristolochia fimbriata TaxID=158543 RepID=A0AAV7EYL1_ARIFI|nr:hypothetical protein H6P81_005546 [Aristolochia fimbriata]
MPPKMKRPGIKRRGTKQMKTPGMNMHRGDYQAQGVTSPVFYHHWGDETKDTKRTTKRYNKDNIIAKICELRRGDNVRGMQLRWGEKGAGEIVAGDWNAGPP